MRLVEGFKFIDENFNRVTIEIKISLGQYFIIRKNNHIHTAMNEEQSKIFIDTYAKENNLTGVK